MGLGLTSYIPYIVYIGCFIVAFLTVFYRVELGLFFLVPLTPWQSIWFKLWDYPLGTNLIDLIIIALLIGWLLRKKNTIKAPARFLIILLIVISFVSLFIGADGFPLDSDNSYLRIWKNFILMPLLYFITLNNINEEKHIKILIFLMALSMLANDFYFYSTFDEWFKGEHFSHKGRISTFVDLGPNEMASFVSQGTMMLLGIWLVNKNKSNLWCYLIGLTILANTYIIVYSFSRASYIAVIVACFFLGLLKERKILIALLLLGALWTTVLPNSVVERVKNSQDEEGRFDHSSQVRIDVWKESITGFFHNPLGTGFSRFRSMGYGDTHARDAHNMVIKILVELGAQGLIVYILLYVWSIKSGWKLFKTANNKFYSGLGLGFISCVIANIICNLFGQDWTLFSVTSYYWVFWALVDKSRFLSQSDIRNQIAT